MVTDGPSPGPSAEPPDLIGVALGALAAGATSGAAVVTLLLVTLRGHLFYALPPMSLTGMVVAAAVAWVLASPITDGWRRGLTAALAVFAGLMLITLTAPADMAGGDAGLYVYAALLLTTAGAAARYSLRSRTPAR